MQRLIDELQRRLGVDPAAGLQILSTASALSVPFDPGMAVLLLPAGAAAGDRQSALPGRAAHALDAATLLRALYPGDTSVIGLDGAADNTVAEVTAAELDRGAHFVPALVGESNTASPHGLPWLVARLRAPDGCPWDREQTHQSLAKFLLEEAYEVYDAIEAGSTSSLAGELGDLLLQIVLHAQYAAEDGVFDLTDVYRQVMAKIVRRHPHVFGDVVAETAADVLRNWEQIKKAERTADGAAGPAATSDMPAAFAGLSRSLPALAYAQEMQERAASLGYDWPAIVDILDKVVEEAGELTRATADHEKREEVGDLLLVMTNLARRMGVDAEAALRTASAKFAARFAAVERMAAEREVDLRTLTADELDQLWKAAKSELSQPFAAVTPK